MINKNIYNFNIYIFFVERYNKVISKRFLSVNIYFIIIKFCEGGGIEVLV